MFCRFYRKYAAKVRKKKQLHKFNGYYFFKLFIFVFCLHLLFFLLVSSIVLSAKAIVAFIPLVSFIHTAIILDSCFFLFAFLPGSSFALPNFAVRVGI